MSNASVVNHISGIREAKLIILKVKNRICAKTHFNHFVHTYEMPKIYFSTFGKVNITYCKGEGKYLLLGSIVQLSQHTCHNILHILPSPFKS